MKVLFVCAGNLFRSVISECIFEQRAGELLGDAAAALGAESSGLEADVKMPPHPDCEAALASIGLVAPLAPPVKTDERQMQAADLVIAMTRQQSYIVASRFPEERHKVFSMLEANGAVWTLLNGKGLLEDDALATAVRGWTPERCDAALLRAIARLTGAERETLYPMAGVALNVRDLMTLFAPCFYHASGVHDPMSGTTEEKEACARLLDREVTDFIRGLVTLAAADEG